MDIWEEVVEVSHLVVGIVEVIEAEAGDSRLIRFILQV